MDKETWKPIFDPWNPPQASININDPVNTATGDKFWENRRDIEI
jgi:hypothetical protein